MEQPDGNPHARIDGLTGEKTIHPQVPMFYYTCDEEIPDLISIMNYCGIRTVNSCQDSPDNRGRVRRVWVEVLAECMHRFLAMLDKPEETGDVESLSNRMAIGRYPRSADGPWDRLDFEDDRAWHYKADIERINGQLAAPTIHVRFPYTDLPEVVERLREAAMQLDGKAFPQSPDKSPDQGESNNQPSPPS